METRASPRYTKATTTTTTTTTAMATMCWRAALRRRRCVLAVVLVLAVLFTALWVPTPLEVQQTAPLEEVRPVSTTTAANRGEFHSKSLEI